MLSYLRTDSPSFTDTIFSPKQLVITRSPSALTEVEVYTQPLSLHCRDPTWRSVLINRRYYWAVSSGVARIVDRAVLCPLYDLMALFNSFIQEGRAADVERALEVLGMAHLRSLAYCWRSICCCRRPLIHNISRWWFFKRRLYRSSCTGFLSLIESFVFPGTSKKRFRGTLVRVYLW